MYRENVLVIEVLIGGFQEDKVVRGQPGEPVAVDTKLGWVLSGPMKGNGEVNNMVIVLMTRRQPVLNWIRMLRGYGMWKH